MEQEEIKRLPKYIRIFSPFLYDYIEARLPDRDAPVIYLTTLHGDRYNINSCYRGKYTIYDKELIEEIPYKKIVGLHGKPTLFAPKTKHIDIQPIVYYYSPNSDPIGITIQYDICTSIIDKYYYNNIYFI